MRAPFDRLIDLFWGPDTATPGASFALAVPARVVPDQAFIDVAQPLSFSTSYITLDSVEPDGPTTVNTELQKWTYDYGKACTVALTTGGEVTHQIVRVELRTWDTGDSYWRAHICPLLDELPSECSTDYAESYDMYLGLTFVGTLLRVGPTTWVFEDYTLEAESGTLDPETCFSTWRLTNDDPGFWVAGYTGVGSVAMAQSAGGTTMNVSPTP